MQRENTISQHLRDLLDTYEEVNIAGVGLFSIIDKPASIDEVNNELYPPTRTLSIQPESESAVDFLEEIQKKFKDHSSQFDLIKSSLSETVLELQKSSLTRVPELGEISIDDDQQLNLVDVHPLWMEGTAYLPVLRLRPVIEKISEEDNSADGVMSGVVDTDEFITAPSAKEISKQSFLPLIVLCLGVVFFLGYLKGCDSDTSQVGEDVAHDLPQSISSKSDSINTLNFNYSDHLTPSILREGCKIVVGSFKLKNNAEGQLSAMAQLGYEVVLSKSTVGYRVVIKFDCLKYNLKEYLEAVQLDGAPNAWFLSPMIKTEDL